MSNSVRPIRLALLISVLAASLAAGETAGPSQGPDVIVGFVTRTQAFGREGTGAAARVGISAATNSCNRGTANINWYALPDARHPAIVVNLYRLANDRLEQLGQSWVKHGFLATNQTDCFNVPNFPHARCQGSGNAPQLSPGCSDLYSADLNADADNLGPRSRINATTGAIINPLTGAADPTRAQDLTGFPQSSRLQRIVYALETDLQVPDAKYFVEGHYIAADDATARNSRNNITYKEVRPVQDVNRVTFLDVVGVQGGGPMTFQEVTREVYGEPVLRAWEGATIFEKTEAEATGGQQGTIIVASKAIRLSGNQHRYEYAIYNMNSHAAVQALTIPTAAIQSGSAGFSAVPSQGELWSNDPWANTVAATGVTWATRRFSELPTANAIRWGTTYNFWFIADSPPATKSATVTRFRPKEGASQPESFTAQVIAPSN